MAAVTRATSIVCNTLGSLPWRHLTGGADSSVANVEVPPERWIYDPMLLRSDSRFPGSTTPAALRLGKGQFWSSFIRAALHEGLGPLIFQEDAAAAPIPGTLRVLNPAMIAPTVVDGVVCREIGSDGSANYRERVITDYEGRFVLGNRRYRLVELNNPLDHPDEYGMTRGVFDMHQEELGLAGQALTYTRSMYRTGVPAGYLKVSVPNYSKDQADKLKAQWLAAHGGDRRSIAVLNSTTDFQPLSFKPVDMDLIKSRTMSLLDIANMFGVPAVFLGYDGSSSNTYSNQQDRNSELQQSLLHWAMAVEDVIGSLLPNGHWLQIDFGGLLRPDLQSRWAAYAQAIQAGWLTITEVRKFEKLGPLEGVEQQHEQN